MPKQKIEPLLERKINCYKVIQCLREKGTLSKKELSFLCNLSRPTIDSILSEFLEKKLIYENGFKLSSNKGRKPILYRFNKTAKYVVGVDFEIPELNIVLCNLNGDPLAKESIDLPMKEDKSEFIIEFVGAKINGLIEKAHIQLKNVIGIGFGTPDFLKNGTLTIFSRDLPNWNKIPVRDILENKLKVPVTLDNDVNLMMLAERTYGGHKDKNLIYVALRRGTKGEIKVGSGILNNGEVLWGAHRNAGWLGHIILNLQKVKCKCGNVGCLEAILNDCLSSSLPHNDKKRFNNRSIRKISRKKFEVVKDYLIVAIFNLIVLFDPEKVIINAEILGDYEESFIEYCRERIKVDLCKKFERKIVIEKARDRDFTCAKGAALLVLQKVFSSPDSLFKMMAI